MEKIASYEGPEPLREPIESALKDVCMIYGKEKLALESFNIKVIFHYIKPLSFKDIDLSHAYYFDTDLISIQIYASSPPEYENGNLVLDFNKMPYTTAQQLKTPEFRKNMEEILFHETSHRIFNKEAKVAGALHIGQARFENILEEKRIEMIEKIEKGVAIVKNEESVFRDYIVFKGFDENLARAFTKKTIGKDYKMSMKTIFHYCHDLYADLLATNPEKIEEFLIRHSYKDILEMNKGEIIKVFGDEKEKVLESILKDSIKYSQEERNKIIYLAILYECF